MTNKLRDWLIGILVIFTFVIPVIPAAGFSLYDKHLATHTTEETITKSIPFQTVYIDSEDYDIGTETTTTDGEEGTLEITYEVKSKGGKEVAREEIDKETTTKPIDEVITRGTYEEDDEYISTYRIGAVCNDGSSSEATGSGACSWHDGVDYWLYNE